MGLSDAGGSAEDILPYRDAGANAHAGAPGSDAGAIANTYSYADAHTDAPSGSCRHGRL